MEKPIEKESMPIDSEKKEEYMAMYVGALVNQLRDGDLGANFEEEEVDEQVLKVLDKDEEFQKVLSEGIPGKEVKRVQGLQFYITDKEIDEAS